MGMYSTAEAEEWYEKKDLMNKGLLPDPDDELHELALKMIAERDVQEGESWSNITEEVAKLMVDFHNSL